MSGIFDATIFDPVIFDTGSTQQQVTYRADYRKKGPHYLGYDHFARLERERQAAKEESAVLPSEDRAGAPLTPAEIDRLSGGPEARAAGEKAEAIHGQLEAQRAQERVVAEAKARDEEIARLLSIAMQREERDIVYVMAALAALD